MTNIAETVDAVRRRMLAACAKSGRSPDDVRLIAVTKRVDAERVKEAIASGVNDLGENYVQEALKKIDAIGPESTQHDTPEATRNARSELNWHVRSEPTWHARSRVTWHMIGHLQTNKAKYIPGAFAYVHSIDSWDLLERLDRFGPRLSVLFEVNISGETQKQGTDPAGLRDILTKIGGLRHVSPVGLMTMPPYGEDPEESRPIFRALKSLLEEINGEFGLSLSELSMGMSSDFEVAIEEGATMIRVGTAIFGGRL